MPGILPYVNFNPETGARGTDDVWVMISQEKHGKNKGEWDFFNGRCDKGETLKQAAVREGYEESCGLFGSQSELARNMITLNHSPDAFLINAEHLKSKKDIMENCTQRKYVVRKSLPKYGSKEFQEKTEVKWVKLSSLVNACATDRILQKNGKPVNGLDGKKITIRAPLVSLVTHNASQLDALLKKQFNTALDIENDKLKKQKNAAVQKNQVLKKQLNVKGKKIDAIKNKALKKQIDLNDKKIHAIQDKQKKILKQKV